MDIVREALLEGTSVYLPNVGPLRPVGPRTAVVTKRWTGGMTVRSLMSEIMRTKDISRREAKKFIWELEDSILSVYNGRSLGIPGFGTITNDNGTVILELT